MENRLDTKNISESVKPRPGGVLCSFPINLALPKPLSLKSTSDTSKPISIVTALAQPVPTICNASDFRAIWDNRDIVPFINLLLRHSGPKKVIMDLAKFLHQPSQPNAIPAITSGLLHDGTKDALRDLPNFGKTPLKPTPSNGWPFVMKDAPNMGKGLFSRETIHFGDVILCEAALIVIAVEIKACIEDTFQNLLLVDLGDDTQQEFERLHNRHEGTGYGRLRGILDTNMRSIGTLPGPYTGEHAVVGLMSSRINHSCSPNAEFIFDPTSLSITIHASRTIEKGEQILIAYTGAKATCSPRQKRQTTLLTKYGFTCLCSSCSLPDRESKQSDARRRRMSRISRENKHRDTVDAEGEKMMDWAFDRSLPDDHIIKESKRFLDLLEKENLCMRGMQMSHCARLCVAYCALGDREATVRWAKRITGLGAMSAGGGGSASEWRLFVDSPEKSPFWGLRRRP